MTAESFDPRNRKYNKVQDLPKAKQKGFVDTEGGGFIKKEAADEARIAQIASLLEDNGLRGKDFQHAEANDINEERDNIIRILDKAIKQDQTGGKWNVDSILNIWDIIKCSKFSKEICDSEEVMLKYASVGGSMAFEDFSDRLKNNKQFILKVLSQKNAGEEEGKARPGHISSVLEYLSQWCGDKEVVLAAIRKNYYSFFYASDELRNEPDVFLEAYQGIPEGYTNTGEMIQELYNVAGEELKEKIEKMRILGQEESVKQVAA